MAKATTLIDDMDGVSTGATPRHFSIGGVDYEIDLVDENYTALLLTLEPWRGIARVGRKPRRQAHPPLTQDQRKELRAWATESGIALAERGRFPNDVVTKFFESRANGHVPTWALEEEYAQT